MPFVTSTVTIERFAEAVYGLQLGSVTLGQVQSDIGSGGISGLNAALNSYYTSAIGNATTAQAASVILANLGLVAGQLGLNAAQVQAANDYIVANLNAAPANARGAQLASILNSFSGMTGDSVYGAAATAFNTLTANSVSWSSSNTADHVIGSASVFKLTTGVDTITGTASNDVFVANLADNTNTFQSGDTLNGGGGNDMLYATLGSSSAFAITASTTGVQQAVFVSQSTNSNGSNANNNVDTTGQKNTVDAGRMVGVTQFWDTDSRADLKIEDVRILDTQITKDITIVMRNTDPGSMNSNNVNGVTGVLNVGAGDNKVDYEVYFSPESLRAASSISTQAITVFVASQLQQGTSLPGSSYDATRPLSNLPYDTLNITANGVAYQLKLDLLGATTAAGHTGLVNLTEADFLYALKATVLQASGGAATVTVNSQAYVYNSTDGAGRSVNTYTITAAGYALGVPSFGVWNASLGLPPTNAFSASAVQGSPVVLKPLVTSTVILDNVGREDEAGSLTIGGMDTRIGVDRFEIKVASNDNNANNEHNSGSWIARAQSTNNVLKEVQITNVVASDNYHEAGIINGQQVDADATANARTLSQITSNVAAMAAETASGTTAAVAATVASSGNSDYLNIGTGTNQAGNNLNELRGFPTLLNTDGLRDVRLFDASTFKGDIKLGAYFDSATSAKYQNLVDTAANDKADDVPFVYTLGSGNDSLNVVIDSSTANLANNVSAGRHDFNFTFSGMDGNDNIQVAIRNVNESGQSNDSGTYGAWDYNQGLINSNSNNNITIDGGNGDDVIRKPGAGNANIIGGTGNDTIYAENTGGSTNVFTDGRADGNNHAYLQAGFATGVSSGYYSAHVSSTNSLNDSKANVSDDGIVGNDGFAKFAFNASPNQDATEGAAPGNTVVYDLDSLRSATPALVNAVNTTLTVNFLGFSKTVNVGTSAGANANTAITDLTVNQAVKDAINNDSVLNKLLVAQDGPGHTLIISSLIDGYMNQAAGTELHISLGNTALNANQALNSSLHLMTAADFGQFGANSTGAYTSVFATTQPVGTTQGSGVPGAAGYVAPVIGSYVLHDGADSSAASDNTITGGTGDDVIVLGTAGYLVDQSLNYNDPYHFVNAQYLGSNDTVVYSGFNNGNDTIVYFDTTLTTQAVVAHTVITPAAAANEIVTLTFSASDGNPGAEKIIFGDQTITLSSTSQGVIPAADVAYQFAHGFGAVSGGATNPGWSIYQLGNSDGTNTVQLIHNGGLADLTSAAFTGNYFDPAATGGGGSVGVVVTQQGVNGLVAGNPATFTVDFAVGSTAASAAGTFTFDGQTIGYAQGAGALTLGTLLSNTKFAHFDTSLDTSSGTDIKVTFTENNVGTTDTVATPTGTTTAGSSGTFTGLTSNNISGSIINATAGTASNGGAFTTTVLPGIAAGADGEGMDHLDFTAYHAGAVYVGSTLVTGALTTTLQDYVQLVESTTQAGLYTVTVNHGGTDGFGGSVVDTQAGVVGTINFGHHENFSAHSFII